MSPDVDPQAFPRDWTWPFVPVHYALLMTCTLSLFVCFSCLALLPFLPCLLSSVCCVRSAVFFRTYFMPSVFASRRPSPKLFLLESNPVDREVSPDRPPCW